MIVGHQLRNCVDAGAQVGKGHHLRFIKDHHTAGNIVELPALGRAAGVQGFKELYRGGNHHRHVPIFGGLSQTNRLRPGFLIHII